MSLWLWLAAPLVGVLLGLFGAGGGMLTVPLLAYGAGLPFKQAIAMSVWIVAAVSLAAAVQQRVWQVARPQLLVAFGLGGITGGVVGAWLGTWVPTWFQQALFGILLIGVGIWTFRTRLRATPPPAQPCRCTVAVLAGIGLGLLTGLLGVGGGFLMVPTLIALGISHLPTAVAHSLILVAANGTVSGITYLGHIDLALALMAAVTLLAMIGSVVGSYLLKRLPVERLQKGFSAGLAGLGVAMLGQFVIP